MDAVHGGDRARFERHLARCGTCAEEVAGLRETTALLGATVPAKPPDMLKQQVLAAAGRVRQLPPSSHVPLWAAGYGRSAGAPARAWPRRLVPAVLVSALAIAVACGGLALTTQHSLSQVQAQSVQRGRAIAAVLNAPDATMLTTHVSAGGRATIVMSHREGALVFTTEALPALPPAKSYELFLMGPTGDRPAGMLPPPHEGMTAPVVATGLAGADKLALMVEPAGGSRRPTSPPVLLLALAS
jgi:hypothetical protein